MEIMSYLNRMLNPVTTYQKQTIADRETEIVALKQELTKRKQENAELRQYVSHNVIIGDFELKNIDPDDLVQAYNFDSVVKEIPEGWFVFEMGQSPTTMTWYCQLVEFASLYNDSVDRQNVPQAKRVMSETKPSAVEALRECIYNIEIGSILHV